MVTRKDKETLLRQRGLIVWLYGLSGAGKTTLADKLAERLHAEKRLTLRLDGDVLRQGLCRGLSFSDEDRAENLRRAAEVAKLAVSSGLVVISSFITPLNSMRAMIREIVGSNDLLEVYVRCPFSTCAARDVKGLYAKAAHDHLPHFTGRDSLFEEPDSQPHLVIDTDSAEVEDCLESLWQKVTPLLSPK